MAVTIPDAPSDVAAFLEGAGLGLTRGSNLFVSEEIPANPFGSGEAGTAVLPRVHVRPAGGPPPAPYFGSGGSDHLLQLSILVRGEREKAQEGFLFARQLASSLQKASIAPYYSVLLRDSQPVSIGRDDHDEPGWSIGLECRFTS